ncbi:FecR family protein [Hydrogenophaga palleronii]|uniref:FecR family protein n=1 Tax=Hydrogenophaga palleronii TaxID=65655 RepID=UPI0008259A57|nr:FecR domain-containing protein [Hydrogenophaga palleronii]
MTDRHLPPSQPPLAAAGAARGARRDADSALPEAGDDGASALDELSAVELAALHWSVRASDGLSESEQAELQAWLQAAPEHRAAYDDMAGVFDAVQAIPPAGTARLRTTLAIDSAQQSSARDMAAQQQRPVTTPPAPADTQTDTDTHTEVVAPARRSGLLRRALPQALAAVVALGVLGGGWFGWAHWQAQPVYSQQFATQRGQQMEARLPDGSRLQMDASTQAEVTLYRQRREVVMPEGQVVFQVQGDRDRPFDVLAGGARITALGTRFSVRYTPSLGQQAVQVAVMEGQVRVAPALGGERPEDVIELHAGHSVSADENGQAGEVKAVSADAMAPWLSQRLSFENTELADVLAELGRYADLPLSIGDAATGALPVTASVDLRNIGSFVRSLPQVLPVRLHKRDGFTEIVGLRG